MNTVHLRLMVIALLALLVSGCASVPMASPEEDRVAKQFRPTPGKATIYLYRNEIFGGAIAMQVMLDGRPMGQTGPETYFRWVVEPGRHTISVAAENVAELSIDTRPGGIYFVWQEIKMGLFMARTRLELVDPQRGMAGVNESSLIAAPYGGGGGSAAPSNTSTSRGGSGGAGATSSSQ